MADPVLTEVVAHSAPSEGQKPQSLEDHARNVADLAGAFAAPFQSERFARWLGWWHDAGKVHPEVQAYLTAEDPPSSGPDHSSAGMLMAQEGLELLAHNIAGHHGGLVNQHDLRARVRRKQKDDRITEALDQARPLIGPHAPSLSREDLPDFLQDPVKEKVRKRRFEFWTRMLHSALVDADCLDTERHFDPSHHAERKNDYTLDALWDRFQTNQKALMEEAEATLLNRRRRAVYQASIETAAQEPGFFSMSVPTGGGKTRSAMGFGLRHALTRGKDRIIIALPYTSIIEQNVDVYRDILGEEVVLEHHSSAGREEEPGDASPAERWRRLAAQNWDAPVVVTTTVQLLESLFANQNRRLRKLHRMANSVIVLDEVQTLPPRLLDATLEGLRELEARYGATILLCTATQPALKARPDFPGLEDLTEIVPDPPALYEDLRRVSYETEIEDPWNWDQVASTLLEEPQSMAILNTVSDAAAVLDLLPRDPSVLHLSTRLCGAHRRRVLDEVRRRLASGAPIRLVATQVVEAGVDISFPRVLRALGPLDSIIQAAGRCNREGKQETGRVTIFEPAEGGTPPGAYRTGRDITRQLFGREPDPALHDPSLPKRYFHKLYDARDIDEAGIQPLRTEFQFETVARRYRLIEDDTTPVLVGYQEGPPLLDEVIERVAHSGFLHREDWQRLQPYTVTLYERALNEAAAEGLARKVASDLDLWRWDGRYEEGTLHKGGDEGGRGLQMEGPDVESLIV